ncbi:hypothetical protein LPUS_07901 [Lasallia pustulata]|uniref:Uncharacterized protein n=1 Tax=Lasallia pustulata TaxID=136370 RepID=A0A1W5D4R8_9LECA|nr:hypothetical protein LPUS_07901 [Lasallia pustulata]
MAPIDIHHPNPPTTLRCTPAVIPFLHLTFHTLLPFLFFATFLISGTVVLAYTLGLSKPIPVHFATGATVAFAVLVLLGGVVFVWLRLRKSNERTVGAEERANARERGDVTAPLTGGPARARRLSPAPIPQSGGKAAGFTAYAPAQRPSMPAAYLPIPELGPEQPPAHQGDHQSPPFAPPISSPLPWLEPAYRPIPGPNPYLYAKPLPIWDLYFTKEMWMELHRATYDLKEEFPVITFQEVIFILRILAHKDSVEWSIEMEDCLLERSGDISDHNHVTEVLNETYGKDGANQITANDAYHKLVELRFSGKNGDIEVWSKEMEELLIALRDLGRDVDQITDEIFTLYNKPHLREDTQLKLLQMAHAKA